MKKEVKVGIFVVFSLIAIFILTFQVGALDKWKREGYVLYAYVDDASGISQKTKVKMRGVIIGDVEDIFFDEDKVKLKLFISKNIKIPLYSIITLSQDSMLGGKYVKIIPSIYKNKFYKPGEIIKHYQKVATIENVLGNINNAVDEIRVLTHNLNDIVVKNNKVINKTFINIQHSTDNLNRLLVMLNKKLPYSIDSINDTVNNFRKNFDTLSSTYVKTGKILNENLPKVLDNVNKLVLKTSNLIEELNSSTTLITTDVHNLANKYQEVGETLNQTIKDTKVDVNQTLASADGFFSYGKKSFDEVNKLLASFTKSELIVNVDEEYFSKDDFFSTNIELSYLPKPDKYYILGLTSKKDYENMSKDKIYVNAEYGKRFENVILRGGIIENSGGVGVDYLFNKDRLKVSTDFYDFNGVNDPRGSNVHIKTKISYLYLKHLKFILGIDNILNSKSTNIFFGFGIKFKDNDLKPFLSGGTSFLK